MRAWLQREVDAKVIQIHLLGGHDFLGAAEGSLAPVAGPNVAGRQCTITREGSTWRLRDVRIATRGTLVNYRYVRDAVLVHGDQVQVGACIFRFGQLPAGGRAAAGARRRDSCP